MVLSALYIFFRDIEYLYDVFVRLLMYMSAIFYSIDTYSETVRKLFLLNPVYLFIRYFRKIVIEATVPTIWFHMLLAADVVIVLGVEHGEQIAYGDTAVVMDDAIAAALDRAFNVGEKKLRELTDGENCPHVLFCGSKRLIKRGKFQNYLEKLFSI